MRHEQSSLGTPLLVARNKTCPSASPNCSRAHKRCTHYLGHGTNAASRHCLWSRRPTALATCGTSTPFPIWHLAPNTRCTRSLQTRASRGFGYSNSSPTDPHSSCTRDRDGSRPKPTPTSINGRAGGRASSSSSSQPRTASRSVTTYDTSAQKHKKAKRVSRVSKAQH